MPELTHTQNYVARIKADLYWIEKLINMRSGKESKRVLVNKLANIGFFSKLRQKCFIERMKNLIFILGYKSSNIVSSVEFPDIF
jgi:glutaredoxin 2